jgi:phosphoserine phosphatase RsbU/P
MARDLAIAREIQMGILPSDLSPCTSGTGLDIHALLEPAQQVGGDLFEVLRASEDHVVVALGDVSGKGIPAALFMAVAITLVRSLARENREPEDILRRVNNELAAQNPRGMFVTLACLAFDLRTGRVTSANAGHNSPVLARPGKPPRLVLPSTGMVAGLFPGIEFTSESMQLEQDDVLILYSDGVTEAFDAQEEAFGEERLLEQLARNPGQSATETAQNVLAAVRQHVRGAPQSDDITVLALRYSPQGAN